MRTGGRAWVFVIGRIFPTAEEDCALPGFVLRVSKCPGRALVILVEFDIHLCH